MAEPSGSLIDNYRQAVSAQPASAEAYSNLGWGYYGQRNYSEAVKAFEYALSLDRSYLDAHYGLGLAHKEAGDKAAALAAFEATVKLAEQLDNAVRGHMLVRLAQGHLNQIESGSWGLDSLGSAG